MAADGLDPEMVAVERWVHRVLHLRARKGLEPLPEPEYVVECWMPWGAPEWALEAARAGEPGEVWCPVLNPDLPGAEWWLTGPTERP